MVGVVCNCRLVTLTMRLFGDGGVRKECLVSDDDGGVERTVVGENEFTIRANLDALTDETG
jgi:hypothetical protein